MKLIAFEFRKNFISLPTLVIIGILLVMNAWKISDVQYTKSNLSSRKAGYEENYWELHKEFAGEITLEKIERLLEIYRPLEKVVEERSASTAYNPDCYIYNEYTDYDFFSDCFVYEMEYDYTYRNYAYDLVLQARKNVNLYERYGNEYESEVNKKLINLFTGRQITEFCYTEPWYYYLFYDYSVILVVFLCIFAMSGVFVIERETEMYMLLATSKRGGIETTVAKLIASGGFVFFVCALFWLEDLFLFGGFFGSFEGLKQPIYALYAFRDTPLAMTLLLYSFYMMLIKTIGIFGCSLFFLLCSYYFKKTLPAFFAGIVISVMLIYLQGNTPGNTLLKCLNPMELVIGRDLFFKCRFVPVFGHAVLQYQVIFTAAIIFYILLIVWLTWVTRIKRRGTEKRRTV